MKLINRLKNDSTKNIMELGKQLVIELVDLCKREGHEGKLTVYCIEGVLIKKIVKIL